MFFRSLAPALAVLVLLTACDQQKTASPTAVPKPDVAAAQPARAVVPSTDASALDQWTGRWIGPEGTFLELTKLGDGYAIKIQSLDGPNSYQGKAASDHIEFERNGRTESIRAATGAETGMKWLAEKKDCLVIQTSEGFCRD